MRAAALLLVLASCGAPGEPAFVVAVGDCAPAARATDPAPARRVHDLVNAHRAARSLPPLRPDPALDAAADWKVRHMAAGRYLAHDDPSPVRRTFAQRIAACGFRATGWAENIATGQPTPEAVMRSWLASAGHRRNIEDPAHTHAGAGMARAANGAPYWAQTFGRAEP